MPEVILCPYCGQPNTVACYKHIALKLGGPCKSDGCYWEEPAEGEPPEDGLPVARLCPGGSCTGLPPIPAEKVYCVDCGGQW